eukprot:XP_016657563.1 PREDICTED: uncharacterized protein LOC107882927 [Acyrthosiphon pisum]
MSMTPHLLYPYQLSCTQTKEKNIVHEEGLKVAVCEGSGDIGEPLSLLLIQTPLITDLAILAPVVSADCTQTKEKNIVHEEGLKVAVCEGLGGIGEPLSFLLKQTPLITDLAILAPGVSEDKPKRKKRQIIPPGSPWYIKNESTQSQD